VVIGTDCTGSCKSNDHPITTTTAPNLTYILLINVINFIEMRDLFNRILPCEFAVLYWRPPPCDWPRHVPVRGVLIFNVTETYNNKIQLEVILLYKSNIYINIWKSSQRMNLRDVGLETSVNDSVQTNKNDK
jgi:hypothetical protein